LPISYRIDAAAGAVFTTASGDLTAEEAAGYLGKLLDQLTAPMNGLIDLREVAGVELDANAVGDLAHLTSSFEERVAGARVALVASRDLVFGMARMYQSLRADAPYEIGVFRDMDEARFWLGLDPA